MHVLLAANWFLDPIVGALGFVVDAIHRIVPNLGVCLIILAAIIRAVFWPLNTAQFRAMIAMQKIAPQLKKLQERYKGDNQKIQQESMALYKQAGANPLAGCWPMLVQYPFLISVYYLVRNNPKIYEATSFLWVNPGAHQHFPKIFGASLAHPDWILIILYAISMYVSMRFTTMPPADPSQAKQMKIMQVISPLMIGFFAYKYEWPSALVVYWLSSNAFQMGQQLYLLRKYHQPLSAIDSDHAVTENVPEPVKPVKAAKQQALPSGNGAAKNASGKKKKKGASK